MKRPTHKRENWIFLQAFKKQEEILTHRQSQLEKSREEEQRGKVLRENAVVATGMYEKVHVHFFFGRQCLFSESTEVDDGVVWMLRLRQLPRSLLTSHSIADLCLISSPNSIQIALVTTFESHHFSESSHGSALLQKKRKTAKNIFSALPNRKRKLLFSRLFKMKNFVFNLRRNIVRFAILKAEDW